ncbi:MAG: glutathionylspermidine synthase family protein [Verrucomicrobiota bacterium]
MQRHPITPRPNWQATVEEQGLTYHTLDGAPYWHESAYYELTSEEVDALEQAANDLHALCIAAAEQVIQQKRWDELAIPSAAVPVILKSWERDDFSLYGRFDFAYDPASGPPKLLEYNADTPTGLVEAAVAQWYWLQDQFKDSDQFNSVHERLIAAWQKLKRTGAERVHLAGIKEHLEDAQTVLYLQDTCHQAELLEKQLFIEDIGWDARRKVFVDLDNEAIETLFKLYPWEWLLAEEFGQHLALESCRMIEPAWKMLLSNKALLPILWELYPEHPNLLPAYSAEAKPAELDSYVLKPKLGREGANVKVVICNRTMAETTGDYGQEGFIAQAYGPVPTFDGYFPIMGVWMVDHEACGLGIREDTNWITSNTSLFTPHIF